MAGQAASGIESDGAGGSAAFSHGPVAGTSQDDPNAGVWTNYFGTRAGFARGSNVSVTFKVWGTMAGYTGWPGAMMNSMVGPWHRNMIDGAAYMSCEGTINNGNAVPGPQNFSNWADADPTGGPGWAGDNASPYLPISWGADWEAANDKATALTVRATLGDTKGVRIEYKTAGAADWIVLGDTREIWGGASAQCFLGWIAMAGKCVIDDIVVETSATVTNKPTPNDPANFNGALFFEDFSNFCPLAYLYPMGHMKAENVAKAIDIGNGDKAFMTNIGYLSNPTAYQWNAWTFSITNGIPTTVGLPTSASYKWSWIRGNNLRATCTAWADKTKPNSAQFPTRSAVNFGFYGNGATATPTDPTFRGYWGGTGGHGWATIGGEFQVGNGMRLVEGNWAGTSTVVPPEGFLNDTVNQGTTFLNAWTNAIDKAHAVHFRVTLGNTRGAMVEWSMDPAGGWTVAGDTRGVRGATYGAGANEALFLGFSSNVTAGLFDDVSIEDDTHRLPEPPTWTPRPNAVEGQNWSVY